MARRLSLRRLRPDPARRHLIAAGLLATMVLLERRAEQMASALGHARRAHGRPRQRKPGRSHRG